MFCPSGHCLCRTLQTLSIQVWNDLQDAENLKTPFHEDTITQSLALHLNRQHPGKNKVHIFSRTAEGENGSDFIWLFFDPSLNRHVRVAVQAKRLYSSGKYDAFKAHQVPKITTYAKIVGGQAIYLTYNYPPVSWRSRWPFWVRAKRRLGLKWIDPPRDLGLVYLEAGHLVGIADRALTPTTIAAHGRPMWHPFCTCSNTSTGDALKDLLVRLNAVPEDEDVGEPKLSETPSIIRRWMVGGDVDGNELRNTLRLGEVDGEGSFSPSFLLGTIVGGSR